MQITMVVAESMADGYAPFAHTHGLSTALSKKGYRVRVIAEDSGPYHKTHFLARLMRYYKINLKAMIALGRTDIMVARGHFAHLPWVWIAHLRGVPVLHEMNGHVYDVATTHRWLTFAQKIITGSYKKQFSTSAGVSCITEEIAGGVRTLGVSVPLKVIGNGVDQDIFYPRQNLEPPQPAEPFAVFASSLTAWHGVSTLLQAINCPEWPAKLKLMIVGDGVQSQIVKDAAARDPRIQYAGLLSQKELGALMCKASLGLCLVDSLTERGLEEVLPLKLFEMMASGLAIIVTDIPGQRDVISSSGAGHIVPAKDPAALARAVADLFESKDRENMGIAGLRAVSDKFSWDHRADEFSNFIKAIFPDKKFL
jgi:glycosyltransferase involved in cell wall biosynthesis